MRYASVLYMFPYCCGYRREVATLSPVPYALGRFHRAQIALRREEKCSFRSSRKNVLDVYKRQVRSWVVGLGARFRDVGLSVRI